MKKFTCDQCGKEHSLFLSMELPLPKIIREMSAEEREKRIRSNNSFFLLDSKWFLMKGKIIVPIKETNKDFSWIVWIKVAKDDFLLNVDKGKRGIKSDAFSYHGWLESILPFYEKSHELKIKFDHSDNLLPLVEVISDSNLRDDQKDGVTMKKAIRLMEKFHHPTNLDI